jgi:coenzyme F420-0:L-glutamate ligase/coenzyme F420-1:gamma-L-glutamate ligase
VFNEIKILPITGIPEVTTKTNIASEIMSGLNRQKISLEDHDILVVTQKIVSKAEGRTIQASSLTPSLFAKKLAKNGKKDEAYYEAVLMESTRIVRQSNDVLITQSNHGFIMANSGIDESNVRPGELTLLPADPDQSAEKIRSAIQSLINNPTLQIAVVISDTWGRPFRNGQVNFCIGSAGINVINDYRGTIDTSGRVLTVSQIAVGDELASAAELIMGKIDRVPVALIRGYRYIPSVDDAKKLLRPDRENLFK